MHRKGEAVYSALEIYMYSYSLLDSSQSAHEIQWLAGNTMAVHHVYITANNVVTAKTAN